MKINANQTQAQNHAAQQQTAAQQAQKSHVQQMVECFDGMQTQQKPALNHQPVQLKASQEFLDLVAQLESKVQGC